MASYAAKASRQTVRSRSLYRRIGSLHHNRYLTATQQQQQQSRSTPNANPNHQQFLHPPGFSKATNYDTAKYLQVNRVLLENHNTSISITLWK